MNKLALFLFLFAALMSNRALYARSGNSIEVEIQGIRSSKGKIFFQLFDRDQKVLEEIVWDIQNGKSVLKFTGLSRGDYAFRYFHDENNNGRLDKNILGVPREGFGFSNDPPIVFGEPSFDKWLFQLKESGKLTTVIKYF